jgi:hypothetical protein
VPSVGRIRQELDYAEIYRQIQGPNSGVARDMLRRGLRVQARARKRAPAKTGRLRTSIDIATQNRTVMGVNTFAIIIGSNLDWAAWVHNGTGLYGPHHTRIVPTRGKILVFVGRRGRYVHVGSVAGQRPRPFLKDALRAVRGKG